MPSHDDAGPPPALPPDRAAPQEPSAWRLTFTYEGSDIRLVAQQRVAMVAPPDDSDRTYAARAGTWVEVRDAAGHGLYRQILADPVRHGYEVHSPEPDEGSRQVEPQAPAGVFQVVVPDLTDAHDVVLHRLDDAALGGARPRKRADRATAQPVVTAVLEETPPFEVS
jgi:hypothetical protein